MINIFKKIMGGNKETELSEYKGFSDFFLRAPEETKKRVIAEAARKANEDQMKVFKESKLKVGTTS